MAHGTSCSDTRVGSIPNGQDKNIIFLSTGTRTPNSNYLPTKPHWKITNATTITVQ